MTLTRLEACPDATTNSTHHLHHDIGRSPNTKSSPLDSRYPGGLNLFVAPHCIGARTQELVESLQNPISGFRQPMLP